MCSASSISAYILFPPLTARDPCNVRVSLSPAADYSNSSLSWRAGGSGSLRPRSGLTAIGRSTRAADALTSHRAQDAAHLGVGVTLASCSDAVAVNATTRDFMWRMSTRVQAARAAQAVHPAQAAMAEFLACVLHGVHPAPAALAAHPAHSAEAAQLKRLRMKLRTHSVGGIPDTRRIWSASGTRRIGNSSRPQRI